MNITEKIKKLGRLKAVSKRALLFQAGDPANGFYYILTGQIRLYKQDAQARELEIAKLGSGEYLGEVILFATDKYPVFAEASADSRVLFFEKQTILSEIEHDPQVARYFLTLIARKCFALNQKLEAVTLQSVRQRLINYLLVLLELAPDRQQIILPAKKVEIARSLGTKPETLSRTLKQLQDEGLLVVSGQKISIKNIAKMLP